MKYIIQIFREHDAPTNDRYGPIVVGGWSDTMWGGDDRDEVIERAKSVFNTSKFYGVRVMENIWEMTKVLGQPM